MNILTELVAVHSGIDCCRIWPRLGILDDSLLYLKRFHVGSVPVMFKNDVYVGSSLGFGTELRFLMLNSLVMRFVLFGNDLHRTYRALLCYALWFRLRYKMRVYRKFWKMCERQSIALQPSLLWPWTCNSFSSGLFAIVCVWCCAFKLPDCAQWGFSFALTSCRGRPLG